VGVAPIEKFGLESFFGCNCVLFGVFVEVVGGGWFVVVVGGLIALEGGCGGWGWWSFQWTLHVVVIVFGGWLGVGSSGGGGGAERVVEGLDEAAAARFVTGSFTNRMSIQHPLISRTNLPNMNHLAINHGRLDRMTLFDLTG